MDKLGAAYRSLFTEVSPSVVIVEQVGRIDYFCVGSVILSEDNTTFVLTQSKILDSFGPAKLMVRFSNGHKEPATLLVRGQGLGEGLCILKTDFYGKCKPVSFFEGPIDHIYTGAVAPATKYSFYRIPGFVVQRSLAAGTDVPGLLIEGSENYFVFACNYGGRSPNWESRLVSGAAFHMNSKVLGIVIGDLGSMWFPPGADPSVCGIYPAKYSEDGFELKVALKASYLQIILRNMVNDDDWQNGLRVKAKVI